MAWAMPEIENSACGIRAQVAAAQTILLRLGGISPRKPSDIEAIVPRHVFSFVTVACSAFSIIESAPEKQ
jgi:hypothetical protein